jgi:hypothetical protein
MHTKLFASLALAAAFSAALALPGAGQAAVLTGTSASSTNTVTDYSAAGAVSFDLDLENFAPTRLAFVLEEADLLGTLSLNAIIRNLSGDGISRFSFSLQGIGIAAVGSVTPTFGSVDQVNVGSNGAGIVFGRPEWAEFHFGNALGEAGASDWLLDTAGLRAGDSFSITAEVPEPSTAALMLSALCMSSLLVVRRKRRG